MIQDLIRLINGEIETGCGTSYSAPLVAKTLAAIDNAIEGEVSKETLTISDLNMEKPIFNEVKS